MDKKAKRNNQVKKILELVQREFESGDRDYYCVLNFRPKDLETLDASSQDKLKKVKTDFVKAIGKSNASTKEKKEFTDFVSTAYDTLSNPEKKKQYDEERLNAVIVSMIRRELISPNQNFYSFFQLAPPGQDLAPLTTEEKAKLEEVGGKYVEAVKQSRVQDEDTLLQFIKHAGDTLAIPATKNQYDQERSKKNLEEMNGGENFQDIEMGEDSEDDGDDGNDPPIGDQSRHGLDEQHLLNLYEGATSILKEYLSQADDPKKKPEELAVEKYEPLDQYNDNIAKSIGEAHRQECIIQYGYLKALFRQISQLQSEIGAANEADKASLSNKLNTVQRQVQKYLVEHHYPRDWALLLGTPVPDADFDTSIPTQWDALYHAFPRSPSRKDEIMIAWTKRVRKEKRYRTGIFVMTPSGLDCRCDDPTFPSFMTEFPQYEYVCSETVRPYKGQLAIFKDAWSAGGRKRNGDLNPIYCVLQIGDLIRVATCSVSDGLVRGTKEMAFQRCEQRGITFHEPVETESPRKRALKTSRENASLQQNASNSSQDAEISDLKAQVGELKSTLSELTSMMRKLTMGGGVKSPVMAQ